MPPPPAPAGYEYDWDVPSCSYVLNPVPCVEGPPPGFSGGDYYWVFGPTSCQWYLVPIDCNGPDQFTCSPEPIVIDPEDKGFHFTSAKNGVKFDFYGNGHPIQLAWPRRESSNGWLVLDRNKNGTIDSAEELFSNISPQPKSATGKPNGFLALAVYDDRRFGGNGDGFIDRRDKIWEQLMVWIDANHGGISQPSELQHLDAAGIHSIALKYTESNRVDEFGNHFHFKGRLNPLKPDEVNRVVFDVFLTQQ